MVAELREAIRQAGGLVGLADLARRWDLSRTRVGQLAGEDDFPEPVATVNSRAVYSGAEVDQWKAGRRVGGRRR